MSLSNRHFTLALGAVLLALPLTASAQGQMDVTRLLNARRALDLTPRQVAQLDSIERIQFAQRQQMAAQMRTVTDSARQNRERMGRSGADADSMRAQMARMRPQMDQMRMRDSVTRAAALRVLTEPQRQKVREMAAEERGRQRGMREAQMRGRQGAVGRGGSRGGSGGGMRGPQRPGTAGRGGVMRPRGPGGMTPPRAPMPPRGRPDSAQN